MRNARPSSWQNVLFVVPALVAAVGVTYMVRKHKNASSAVATNPTAPAFRTLASKIDLMSEDEDTPEQDLSAMPAHRTAKHGSNESSDEGRSPASVTGISSNICTSFELRGDGVVGTHISNTEWNQVLEVFHQSKTDLQSWLTQHKKEVSPELATWMGKQVEEAKIQRPPSAEEPDLAWRGIGYVSHSGTGSDSTPWVRIGGGFVKMVITQPKRARFELTRLLAQSWNSCDLPAGAQSTWVPLLQCVGMKEQEWDSKKTCLAGSESEAGWAIGSAVAYSVSAPDCVLPVFEKAAISHCITKAAWLTPDNRGPASVNETPIINSVVTVPGIAAPITVEAKFKAVDKGVNQGLNPAIKKPINEAVKVGKDQ